MIIPNAFSRKADAKIVVYFEMRKERKNILRSTKIDPDSNQEKQVENSYTIAIGKVSHVGRE